MASNRKNRGRCNISKSIKINCHFFLGSILLSFIVSLLFLKYIDYRLNTILKNYIDSEVDKISSIVIEKSLNKINNNEKNDFIIISNSNLTYNTKEINTFKNKLNSTIQKEFNNIETGNFDDYMLLQQKKLKEKYPFFNKGYLCEVSMNTIRGSTVLGNIGPTIPVKLSFMGYVESNVEANVKEYGINNALIEISVIVKINNLISMPISTRTHESVVKSIISIELIKGEIPSYYLGELK